MKVKRIEHIAIAAPSLAKSIALFRDAFGIEMEYEEKIGSIRLAMLPVGETYIELLEGEADGDPVHQWIAEKGAGLWHICLEVEDIDGAFAELKAKGVKLQDETPRIRPRRLPDRVPRSGLDRRRADRTRRNAGGSLNAEASMSDGFVHPEYLVETGWLAGHLDDRDVLVFDCTTHLIPDPKITYQVDPGREDFEQAHIPGAQFIDVQGDVSDTSAAPALHGARRGCLRRRHAPLRGQREQPGGALQRRQRLVGDARVVAAARCSATTTPRC